MLVFMAIIIFVFVLYFGTDRGSQTTNNLAVIDGNVITEAEYYNEYNKVADVVKTRYGGALTAEMIKLMDLKKMAYDNLINRQIIIAKARDLKLQVSDDELRQILINMPALQTDGKFDNYKYKQLLRYNKLTAEDFEASQKVSLAAGKIETIIREGIKVSDKEILDLYTLQNQKINLQYVQISGASVSKKVTVSESDLENYLKSNGSAFRVPEQVKIKYLYFGPDAYASADISASDIKDYYNRSKESLKGKDGKSMSLEQATPRISRELQKSRGMQKAFAEAKKAHDTIYQESNFDAYAATNHLRVQTMDFFPLNKIPQVFSAIGNLSQQLAGLERKDISKVLSSENGYYLFFVEDKKAAYTPQLKNIEKEVRESYVKHQQEKIAAEEAQTILAALSEGKSMDQLALSRGLKIQETGLFQPTSDIPGLGAHPEAMEAILALSPGRPYTEKPLKFNNAQVIFRLKELSAIDLSDFEAKKETYRNVATNMKKEEAIKSWLEGNKQAMIKDKRMKINKEAKDL